MVRIEAHLVRRSLEGPDEDCGDTGLIHFRPGHCLLALVDALGHGPEAAVVARLALQYLESHVELAPGEMLSGLHEALRGTRGANASICQVALEAGDVTFSGAGNVGARILGTHATSFISIDGVIGDRMRRPREQIARLGSGDVLVMFSDGIRSDFNVNELAHAWRNPASFIASEILKRYGKQEDDASCLVARGLA